MPEAVEGDLKDEPCGVPLIGTNCQKHRLLAERDEALESVRELYWVLKALDERGHTQATWSLAKLAMANAERHHADCLSRTSGSK